VYRYVYIHIDIYIHTHKHKRLTHQYTHTHIHTYTHTIPASVIIVWLFTLIRQFGGFVSPQVDQGRFFGEISCACVFVCGCVCECSERFMTIFRISGAPDGVFWFVHHQVWGIYVRQKSFMHGVTYLYEMTHSNGTWLIHLRVLGHDSFVYMFWFVRHKAWVIYMRQSMSHAYER